MNNRLNFFKRLTAFLLAMLLVTTMMGNDFFSLATSDEIITEESVETGDSNSAPEATPVPEAVDIPQEHAAEEDAIFIGGSNYLVSDAISRFTY